MTIGTLVKEFDIETYECDKNSNLRIVTLMNMFQAVADTHAGIIGVGLELCLSKGMAWVGTGYHIKINRMPKMHEKITITTWPSQAGKLIAVRDFRIVNEQGEVLVAASSQWALISVERKRPLALQDHLPEYPITPERALETDFPKLEDISEINNEIAFRVRFDDIDINNHVNNAIYPLWALEGVDNEFRDKNYPAEIMISFKKEGHLGENVNVLTKMDGMTSLHSIKGQDDRELSRLKVLWNKY